jgi:hypothetical protein
MTEIRVSVPEALFERVSFWTCLRHYSWRVAVGLLLSRLQYRVIHGHWKRYYR